MVIIGSDHSGIDLKKDIIKYLSEKNIKYNDVTNFENQDGDDYPDVAYLICKNVLSNEENVGIAICGTGIGISIACNKIKGISAALVTSSNMAELAKKHNNANVLCLGARLDYVKNFEIVKEIIDLFLETKFEGGRHIQRINKITKLEESVKGGM